MKKMEGFFKGIDLGGWFSQCDYSKDRFDNFIKEKDFQVISENGMDHVRLPVDYNLLETEDGSEYLDEGFAYVEKVCGWCKKYNLNLVLDLHKTAGYSFDAGEGQFGFFDSEDLQERFYRLWEKLASVFGKRDYIAFELLNEVTDKAFSDRWNKISTKCIERIRAFAPDTYILLGGYWNNSIDALEDLALPYDDKVVYNFHCYEPLLFTHQGAYWVPNMDKNFRIKFPQAASDYKKGAEKIEFCNSWCFDGTANGIVDEAIFERFFEKAIKVANERNVALYCGEYGCIDLADREGTINWYKGIHSAFEKYGIGRAAWSYREMDFGLFDAEGKMIIPELKDLL